MKMFNFISILFIKINFISNESNIFTDLKDIIFSGFSGSLLSQSFSNKPINDNT